MKGVIIVDDDKDTVDTIEKFMELENIKVLGKGFNGEECYQLYKQFQPDVVILDMKMPEYDGAYAVTKIKKEFPEAKFIVITAYTNYEFNRGEVRAILTKPYEMDELIKIVKELL